MNELSTRIDEFHQRSKSSAQILIQKICSIKYLSRDFNSIISHARHHVEVGGKDFSPFIFLKLDVTLFLLHKILFFRLGMQDLPLMHASPVQRY